MRITTFDNICTGRDARLNYSRRPSFGIVSKKLNHLVNINAQYSLENAYNSFQQSDFKTSPSHQNQLSNIISYSCTAFILFYFSIRTKLLLLFPIIFFLNFANFPILTNYSSTVLLSNFPTFTNYSSTVFLLHLLNTLCTKLLFHCSYFSKFPLYYC